MYNIFISSISSLVLGCPYFGWFFVPDAFRWPMDSPGPGEKAVVEAKRRRKGLRRCNGTVDLGNVKAGRNVKDFWGNFQEF